MLRNLCYRVLNGNKIKTIAMESTGFYWKNLFLLQDYGFEVILINAAHIKNMREKKSDVLDCQWMWQLHTAGLLHASFQPDHFTEQLRYTRHRKSLIEGAIPLCVENAKGDGHYEYSLTSSAFRHCWAKWTGHY